jgi:hypothetical protein
MNILGPDRFRPGPPRNIKTTFGWFFIMTEYQSSAWEITLQVNHGVAT